MTEQGNPYTVRLILSSPQGHLLLIFPLFVLPAFDFASLSYLNEEKKK